MSGVIVAAARISTPYGWLYLGTGTQYRIAGAAFEDRQTSFRRSEVSSPYVEGTFVINVLRENVTETLEVLVEDREELSLPDAVGALSAAVSQVRYVVQVQLRQDLWTWNAYAADHSVQTKREFIHARLATVRAEIPREPRADYEAVPAGYVPDGPNVSADYSNAEIAPYLLGRGGAVSPETLSELTESVAWPLPEVI